MVWHLCVGLLLAAGPEPAAYALVVGSNPGGAGQADLRFAERDAERIATLLTELGRYPAENVSLVLEPSRETLEAALATIRGNLERHAAAGEQARLFFYYSGHARSQALNLGEEELPLDQLRDALLSLPATLSIVVLDACQSGSFSKVKGSAPAADFSYNSVARLNTAGVAVMASSAGAELSQESETLESSYFTHHLLVALRGAGDQNHDGVVTLDEAHSYAYHQTLAATATTAVGRQHVTLETDLRGKGDVALSYPAAADAWLRIPAETAATILVRQKAAGTIMAEVYKVAGESMTLALPAATYNAVVRLENEARVCEVSVPGRQETVLYHDRCRPIPLASDEAKGKVYRDLPRLEVSAGLELSLSAGQDAYTDRLADFRFEGQGGLVNLRVELGVARQITDVWAVRVAVRQLESRAYSRTIDQRNSSFSWSTWGVTAALRLSRAHFGGVLVPFVELGGGPSWSSSSYTDESGASPTQVDEMRWRYHLLGDLGLRLLPGRRGRHLLGRAIGFVVKAGYVKAPTLDNLLGDTHESGGPFVSLSLVGVME